MPKCPSSRCQRSHLVILSMRSVQKKAILIGTAVLEKCVPSSPARLILPCRPALVTIILIIAFEHVRPSAGQISNTYAFAGKLTFHDSARSRRNQFSSRFRFRRFAFLCWTAGGGKRSISDQFQAVLRGDRENQTYMSVKSGFLIACRNASATAAASTPLSLAPAPAAGPPGDVKLP